MEKNKRKRSACKKERKKEGRGRNRIVIIKEERGKEGRREKGYLGGNGGSKSDLGDFITIIISFNIDILKGRHSS